MENAADALKMAAAVIIFIIAIASSFSLFGTAKQTADSIIGMRDKQKYLEAATLDNGVLYTSASTIAGNSTDAVTTETVAGLTRNGDRIVSVADVIAAIQRYNKEKYGVTIVYGRNIGSHRTGEVLARYDSNTDNIMRQYYNISDGLSVYIEDLNKNTATSYVQPQFSKSVLESLYYIEVDGNNKVRCGAPWYGSEEEIQKRIKVDLYIGGYGIIGKDTYQYNGQTYFGNHLMEKLKGKTIIEVTNEIDQSAYLQDSETKTNLLQQYEMPTVEIIYIIY